MKKFILGTKGKMLTVFTDEGRAFAATVVVAAPNVVTQVKTKEQDGYHAVQLGAGETKDKYVAKAQLGHAHAAQSGTEEGERKALRHFIEFKDRLGAALEGFEVGQAVDVSIFTAGDKVTVTATSKGKGFQGVIKRHGFHGGPRSHGQKHSERSPGSIGGGGGRAGGRVAKGMRMAGRMGSDRVSVRNLAVLQVLPESNEIVIAGAIPGKKGTLVEIKG